MNDALITNLISDIFAKIKILEKLLHRPFEEMMHNSDSLLPDVIDLNSPIYKHANDQIKKDFKTTLVEFILLIEKTMRSLIDKSSPKDPITMLKIQYIVFLINFNIEKKFSEKIKEIFKNKTFLPKVQLPKMSIFLLTLELKYLFQTKRERKIIKKFLFLTKEESSKININFFKDRMNLSSKPIDLISVDSTFLNVKSFYMRESQAFEKTFQINFVIKIECVPFQFRLDQLKVVLKTNFEEYSIITSDPEIHFFGTEHYEFCVSFPSNKNYENLKFNLISIEFVKNGLNFSLNSFSNNVTSEISINELSHFTVNFFGFFNQIDKNLVYIKKYDANEYWIELSTFHEDDILMKNISVEFFTFSNNFSLDKIVLIKNGKDETECLLKDNVFNVELKSKTCYVIIVKINFHTLEKKEFSMKMIIEFNRKSHGFMLGIKEEETVFGYLDTNLTGSSKEFCQLMLKNKSENKIKINKIGKKSINPCLELLQQEKHSFILKKNDFGPIEIILCDKKVGNFIPKKLFSILKPNIYEELKVKENFMAFTRFYFDFDFLIDEIEIGTKPPLKLFRISHFILKYSTFVLEDKKNIDEEDDYFLVLKWDLEKYQILGKTKFLLKPISQKSKKTITFVPILSGLCNFPKFYLLKVDADGVETKYPVLNKFSSKSFYVQDEFELRSPIFELKIRFDAFLKS